MREKLEIRCSTESVFEPYIKNYPKFQKKWLTKDWELTKVIEGYLDDIEFMEFLEYLRSKINYAVSSITRDYSQEELLGAGLLQLIISAVFEPTGEEAGTEYEDPCPVCKAGRKVKGQLVLDLTKVPKHKDFAETIARDEWIVSEKLSTLIKNQKITGLELKTVQHSGKSKTKSAWYQMVVNSIVTVNRQTKYGDAFRPRLDVNRIMSACGHAINHVIYSELYIDKDSWDGSDIGKTNIYFGGQKNLIYPYPCILISGRFYKLLIEHNVRGYKVEVAHLV